MSEATTEIEKDYLALIRRFPLRTLRTRKDHVTARKTLRTILIKGDSQTSRGEHDYAEVLIQIIAAYERKAESNFGGREPTPLQVLRHVMKERGMTSSELGDLIGSRPAASMILKGKREMSKAHIRLIADRFKVSPALFL